MKYCVRLYTTPARIRRRFTISSASPVKGRSSTIRASAGSASYGEDSGGSGSSSVLGSAGEPDAAADDAGASGEGDEQPPDRSRRRTGATREAARVRFTIFMPYELRSHGMSWEQ